MKKFLFSFSLVVVSAFYALFINQASLSVVPPVTPSETAGSNPIASIPAAPVTPLISTPVPTEPPPKKTTQTPAPTPVPTPTPTPTPAPKPKGLYNEGTYTGNRADAYYGIVQVQATIQGGKIVDVQFLQYPNDRSTSRYINGQAMPYLKQEAIQAQSANVDIVSGATDTSIAFQESLGAALAQAKN